MGDFEMTSRLNQRLTIEEAKALFGMTDATHLPARYHQVIIPRFVPKVFSVNSGPKGVDDEPQHGHWFAEQGLQGLARLVANDTDGLTRLSDHEKGCARRVIVFVVPDRIVTTDAKEDLDQVLDALVAEQLLRESTMTD